MTPQERLQTTYVGSGWIAGFVLALPVFAVFVV